MRSRDWALALVVAVGACNARTLDLGATGTDAGQDSGGGPANGSIDGAWAGYVQFLQLQDGTGDLRVTFDQPSDGATLRGSVFFGNVPALAPPTDPDRGYPPGYWTQDGGIVQGTPRPAEGFAFTARDLTNEGGHVRFSLSSNQVWQAWCGIQTKIYVEADGGGYSCCKDPVIEDDGGGWWVCDDTSPSDVGKVYVCRGYAVAGCSCSATSCTVDESHPDVHFDMQFEGGQFKSGSVMGLGSTIYSLYLARAQ